jgi:hypothetical protein
MSRPVEAAPVLGLCSCITGRPELLPGLERELIRAFGEIALTSDPFAFDTSPYYREEMGEELQRYWYGFRKLWRPERLASYRTATGTLEVAFGKKGRRQVNLDPGYLDLGKLVLASLKEAPDKIYVGECVWAHICLRYDSGSFFAPEHSFPDFQDGRFDRFMLRARTLYKSLLRGERE